MTRHQTVQQQQTNRPAPTPHSQQTTSTGHTSPITPPARNPRLNDQATPGGAGNLGPAGSTPTAPEGGGTSSSDGA